MKKILILYFLLIVASCSLDNRESKYLRWVGDSEFDAEIDTSNFQLCHKEFKAKQYFHFDKGLQYEGEKKELRSQFKEKYIPIDTDQSGLIRIRFIVNCEGEIGRFRMISSDLNYQEQIFDQRITDQLLSITKSLEGWIAQSIREKTRDYYQYLIFKIVNGELTDIMP